MSHSVALHLIHLQIAVVLMDCQGTGDTVNGDTNLDNLIHYIGLQAATVQIVNIQNRLQNSHVNDIQVQCSNQL